MVWRLLWDRLPTMDNLAKRNIAANANPLSCCCNSDLETAKHLFVMCPAIAQLWNLVVAWVGSSWAAPDDIARHRRSFVNLLGNGKVRKLMGGLWTCVIWTIWKWRNAVLFEDKEWNFRKLEMEIKCRFWSWCVVRGNAGQGMSYSHWSSNCLSDQWKSV